MSPKTIRLWLMVSGPDERLIEQAAPRLTAVASPILCLMFWSRQKQWGSEKGEGAGSSSRIQEHLFCS